MRDTTPSLPANSRVLVCMNHPSWWDPLIALTLARRFFPTYRHYAPMAASALTKYKFFARIGIFGVDQNSYAGAARFLRIGSAVLAHPGSAFWVTAQGSFRDPRQRPTTIEPGVGHLAARARGIVLLPLALEYTFWNERKPQAFAAFGAPLFIEDGRRQTATDWTARFARALEITQNVLAQNVVAREAGRFEPLLTGKTGVGGVYDFWRSLNARLHGRKFQPGHGEL